MLKTLLTIGSLACGLTFTVTGHSQAVPTATGGGALQVGVGYTIASPDYGQKKIQGVTGFADFDLAAHYGIEADVHYISVITPLDLAENTFLVGPRFIYPRGRFKLYAKGLVGAGDFVVQERNGNYNRDTVAGTQFAYALGGGLDIRASKHLMIRAGDFEYQHWNYLTGLTPMVFTTGVAYRFR